MTNNTFNAVFQDPDSAESRAWCENHFRIMREGGTWGVPRSGLIFQKRSGKLVLTMRMPHMPQMPVTPEQLKRQQDGDFNVIRKHFAAVGVAVEDESQ